MKNVSWLHRFEKNGENVYPVYFPKRNLTIKMVEWSIVMPRFIREKKGFMNTVLRLEQEGEQ